MIAVEGKLGIKAKRHHVLEPLGPFFFLNNPPRPCRFFYDCGKIKDMVLHPA